VRLTVTRGTSVISNNSVDMAAGEAISQVVPLPPAGGARLLAHVEAPNDGLAEDNDAFAWIDGADALEVTVVSENPGLLAALGLDQRVHATFVKPADCRASRDGVVIFDRWLPDQPPGRPALAIAPPASAWLGKRGDEEKAARW